MKPSKDKPEMIRPNIFYEAQGIEAWFTCKNADLYSTGQKIPGLNIGFNTREAKEVVRKNRKKLLNALGIQPEKVAFAEQVHGNRVQVVSQGGTFENVDALITSVKGLSLAIQVADCAAVLMADSNNGVIAAAHAGWRGAAADILPKTVAAMTSLGAETSNIKAFISPCISKENFEVGEEVAEKFPPEYVDYKTYNKPHVDLKGFLEDQLLKLGIDRTRIEVNEGCTMEDAERFYSYRREQQGSGRMLGLIRYKDIGA